MKNPLYTGPELCGMTAIEVVSLLKRGCISPLEALESSLFRIKQIDSKVNAIPTLCEERARLSINKILDYKSLFGLNAGWLSGLPIAIKDLTEVEGVRTTWGTVGYKDFISKSSDPIVTKLERNGGVVIGKSNTPEMGAGGNTTNEIFGSTKNPWNTKKNAGGSSGGAAVSVATGEVWLSHGSDLAGSLRMPAAYCGVVGLRPTPGRAGGAPPAISFNLESVPGPIARTVSDVALFLDAMSGYDSTSPISFPACSRSFQDAVTRAESNKKIAFSLDLGGFSKADREIDIAIVSALNLLQRNGFKVDNKCPDINGLHETYITLRAMVWASGPGYQPEHIQNKFKASLKQNIEEGRLLSVKSIYDAQRSRAKLYNTMHAFLEQYDVFACPVISTMPGNVDEEYPKELSFSKSHDSYVEWMRFSFLATTTGLPAISLPVGRSKAGMPIGMQLIGPPRGEAKLLSVARSIELILSLPHSPIDPVTV